MVLFLCFLKGMKLNSSQYINLIYSLWEGYRCNKFRTFYEIYFESANFQMIYFYQLLFGDNRIDFFDTEKNKDTKLRQKLKNNFSVWNLFTYDV